VGSVFLGVFAESAETGDRSYPPSESNAVVIESKDELLEKLEQLSLKADGDSDDETSSNFACASCEPPFSDSVHNNSDNDE
jgi:hypothetical protein